MRDFNGSYVHTRLRHSDNDKESQQILISENDSIYIWVDNHCICLYWIRLIKYITCDNSAIVNRTPQIGRPELITHYFEVGGWEVTILQGLYMMHIATTLPEFVLISK